MATDHPITPFPDHIDRDAFGNWLSGFTDGEGCFMLSLRKRPHRGDNIWDAAAAFYLTLRADDADILRQVRSYWQVGRLTHLSNESHRLKNGSNARPQMIFRVTRWLHLAEVIIPHFDRYPLRAKKSRDFTIWRQGVLLGAMVSQRAQRGYHTAKWKPEERQDFAALRNDLRAQREFTAPVAVSGPEGAAEAGLFDDLQA